ncbi:MAG: trigger factor [Betaproteobacteria bacterium AqS2]|uniref:Trigger factor n=1 Tax=Candidatus Amphirhobacter heronislandensis TaxID=1732024 RepID=A0A930UHY1_9GAMM|nr:trigger factor [Betaproteobacteria bacterium AqS2]
MNTTTSAAAAPPARVVSMADGEQPLERRVVVEASAAPAKAEAEKALLRLARERRTPGFRKNSRVVPPVVRQRWGSDEINKALYRLCYPAVVTKIQEEGLRCFPTVRMIAVKDDKPEAYEVTMSFDVHPDVPEPDLEGVRLRKPVPEIDDATVAMVIDRIRRQRAKWNPVERPAAAGDRVAYARAGTEERRQLVIGDARVPPQLSQAFTGRQPPEECVIKVKNGAGPAEEMRFVLHGVEEPELPPLDLDFARGVFAEIGSVDAFRAQIKEEIERQAADMARGIAASRAAFALDRATAEFELPGMLLEQHSREQIAEIDREASQAGTSRAALGIKDEEVRARLRQQMRAGMLTGAYAMRHEIRATEDEIAAQALRQAQQNSDPERFLEEFRASERLQGQAADAVVRAKVADHLCAAVDAEEVRMPLDELEAIIQQGDPETRGLAQPPAEPDKPDEEGKAA